MTRIGLLNIRDKFPHILWDIISIGLLFGPRGLGLCVNEQADLVSLSGIDGSPDSPIKDLAPRTRRHRQVAG